MWCSWIRSAIRITSDLIQLASLVICLASLTLAGIGGEISSKPMDLGRDEQII